MIKYLIFLGFFITFVNCDSLPSGAIIADDHANKATQENLMTMSYCFPNICIKDSIPIEEVWTDYLGGFLHTFQYVEPKNTTKPFYRIYINALVFLKDRHIINYTKFHVIIEQWAFDKDHDRYVILYWGVMNPYEMIPYVEFRLIHKRKLRVLLDERQGRRTEKDHHLVNKIRRVINDMHYKKTVEEKGHRLHDML